ncbi:hypothetical protein IP92_04768 [Pseudoduganella flava]|uniref:Band 7 domain-containing protein n=1 Tax=Pseudoduganella flava TaxID=871742 RepID=A0A562PGY3_9BURK|nr:hypothetical protein [Pseudoduganella flava]QGZ42564.1 hypothetical protein GO485_28370 [Pseudoduganella flava]TWI43715.1 hypothetical protein IP92_04768 [Pseudoduganella flava]
MFKMFGIGGVKCPRCGQRNGADGYCAQCGLSLGAPRSEPVLVDNRWVPAADELAVYFGVRELSGIFTKTLRVPPTSRAYILQGSTATEVPQGEYELEGFFQRLNNLLRDQHAEILITRTTPLPVAFALEDLATAEHLKVAASFTVGVKVEHVAAFAQHFMTAPGTVTTRHLQELLAPSVRQIAAEFVGARSIREMSTNHELRLQLDERLQSALKLRLAEFGLAAVQVETLALRHDKYDANRARVGSLWLVADERHAQIEHTKHLDELYDEEEWQALLREEQKARSEYRRAELRQDATVDKAELSLREAERMQAVRAREIDLYARIVESRTRKQAVERGAGAAAAELEHELAQRAATHAGDAAEWEHVRRLAQIRMRTEMEVAQQQAVEERALAKQRFTHQLHLQQIRNQMEQALAIEDETLRRGEAQRLRQAEQDAQRREAEIEAQHHAGRLHAVELANLARRREVERLREWEEELHAARTRELARGEALKDAGSQVDVAQVTARLDELRRSGASAEALAQHEKLLRTIEADGIAQRQAQAIAHEAEENRVLLKLREHEAQWQQELRRLELEREERYARARSEYETMVAQQNHAAELARIEIERIEAIGNLSDTGKVALAPTANAQALAQLLKVQTHSGMGADQLQALASVVAAENSVSPLEAMRLAQQTVADERARADAQQDKDRQHQLELLKLQNATHANALASQMQLGVGVAQAGAPVHHHHAPAQAGVRCCVNGHPAPADKPEAKFCAECGVPLQR